MLVLCAMPPFSTAPCRDVPFAVGARLLVFAAGALLLALGLFRRKAWAWPRLYAPLALMVAVLGGFLYHMLFEAKSQYLMIYLPMMAPLGAWGLTWCRKGVKAPPAP